MNILIIGAIKDVYPIVGELARTGNHIVIVDNSKERASYYTSKSIDIAIHVLNPIDYDALVEVGLPRADIVLAIHPSDTVNFIVGMYAKNLNIPKIIVLISDEKLARILLNLGITRAVIAKNRLINRGLIEALYDVKIIDVDEDNYLILIDSNVRSELIGLSIGEIVEKLFKVVAVISGEERRVVIDKYHIVEKGDKIIALISRSELTKILRIQA
ncbi:MAG: NAD-binding protein [Acidilobaceae archaeon]